MKTELDQINHELLYLYFIQRTYIRTQIKKFKAGRSGTVDDWNDYWVSCKCMETDMIMRLTKLDEDKKGYHTIHSVWKEYEVFEKKVSLKKEVRKQMKDYRKSINGLKNSYRNSVIAHLSKGSRDDFKMYLDLSKHIQILSQFVDAVSGKQMRYLWKENGVEIDLVEDTNKIMADFRSKYEQS